MTTFENGITNEGYAASIARYLRRLALGEEGEAFRAGPRSTDRWTAMEDLAEHVLQVGDDDPGVVAIWRAQGASLKPSAAFDPGPAQQKLIQAALPSKPDEALSRLVAASIEDLSEATEQRATAQAAPQLARMRRDLEFAESQLGREREEIRRLSDEIADKDRIIAATETDRRSAYAKLRKLLTGTGEEIDEDAADLSRARALPGFDGVYIRETKDGALTFTARWPKPGKPGKSESRAGFATPQAAAEHRDSRLGADDPAAARERHEAEVEARRQQEAAEARQQIAAVEAAKKMNPGLSTRAAERLVGVTPGPSERSDD